MACTRLHGSHVDVQNINKNVFWEFGSIIMQNASDILLLFSTPIWPPNHVSVNQELEVDKTGSFLPVRAFSRCDWVMSLSVSD